MAELTERIATLETQAKQNEDLHKSMNGNLQRIWETLDKMKDDMAKRPPLWSTFLLTALFSLATGLIVYLVSH